MLDPYRDETATLDERLRTLRAEAGELDRLLAAQRGLVERRALVGEEIDRLVGRLDALRAGPSMRCAAARAEQRRARHFAIVTISGTLAAVSAFFWSHVEIDVSHGAPPGALIYDEPLGTDLPEHVPAEPAKGDLGERDSDLAPRRCKDGSRRGGRHHTDDDGESCERVRPRDRR